MNERWREREGEEVRNMEQMHGRGGEEHTHMRTCISHTYTIKQHHCIQLDRCKVYLCLMKTGSDGSPCSWSRYLKRIAPMDPIPFGSSPGCY